MLRALADLHRDVTLGNPGILDILERLVGRLGHISQIYAAIKLWIAAGYALIRLRYRARPTRFGRRALVRQVQLRRGGRRERKLLQLCDAATRELELNP